MTIQVVTAVFRNRRRAEQAFYMLHAYGHSDNEIDVLMSRKTRTLHYAGDGAGAFEPLASAPQAGGMRTAASTTVQAAVGAIAARGTTLPISDLQVIIAGPIAEELSSDGMVVDKRRSANSSTGGLVDYINAFQAAFRDGGIGIGVAAHQSKDISALKAEFEKLEGETASIRLETKY